MIGRIYKIVHGQSDLVYVGMTTNSLAKRWSCYKSDFDKDNHSKISIYPYMKKYGINQFKIILVKEYDVVDKKHLKVYETLWINKLRCINKVPSFNPMNKSQKDKMCYLKHREKRLEAVRKYQNENKEKISERDKIYREKNKEKLYESRKKDYICECGGKTKINHKLRHLRSKFHINYLNQTT